MNKQYTSKMYFFPGYIIFLGSLPSPKLHSHHAMEIFIGHDKPVKLVTEKGIYEDYAILIKSDISHTLVEIEKKMTVIILDPESLIAQKLKTDFLENKDIASLKIDTIFPAIKEYFINPTDKIAERIYHTFNIALGAIESISDKKDKRIIKAINYIKNLEIKKISTREIAEYVGLSEGRLTHLFKEQIGIPVRKYLIWMRIGHALETIFRGDSLTSAAHNAVFADYAHLSRSFSKMFGYPLSMFTRNIKFIFINIPL